jgi:hypothetical protein
MKTINEFLKDGALCDLDVSQKDLQQIADRVLAPLIAANTLDPVLFRHGARPVWVELDDHRKPVFREISQDRMRSLLARRFLWFRLNRKGNEVSVCPPIEVVRDLLALPNIDLPVVERIVSVPIFATDGTIQIETGYNAGTRCIFLPCDSLDAMLPVSDSPDNDEMADALSLFDMLVVDFPFVGAGKTHTLAALLVPFVRALIKGPTPLHLFEKPAPGTGATLLAQVICDICVGYPVASMTESRGEDEFGRKIHSKLRAGPAVILLDNLRNRLDSGALAAALTGDLFEDRLVQRSETVAAPVRCLWLGTANNPSLSGEMARRTIPIRLDARMPRPHLRTDFQNPNLREWVHSSHTVLVWAMLTLVRGWLAAGAPKGTRKLGMYESYSEVIGGILGIAKVSGFLDIPQEQARLEDDESDLAPLVPLWSKQFHFEPVSAAELLPLCGSAGVVLGGKAETEQKIRLGQLLRANRDRCFGDVVIAIGGSRAGSNLWRLTPIGGGLATNGLSDELVHAEGVGEWGSTLKCEVNPWSETRS